MKSILTQTLAIMMKPVARKEMEQNAIPSPYSFKRENNNMYVYERVDHIPCCVCIIRGNIRLGESQKKQ
jgi:predicted transcriptional regulator